MKYIKIFDYLPNDTKTVFATVLLSTLTFHTKQDDSKSKQTSKSKSSITAFNMLSAGSLMQDTYFVNDLNAELIKVKQNKNQTVDSVMALKPIKPVKTNDVKAAPVADKLVSKTDSEIKIIVGKRTVKYVYKDGTVEIREGGTLAWRNKNPGALRGASTAVGKANKFAVFATEEEGMAAMKDLLRSDKYCNLSLKAAIFKYAPPHENNTKKYQSDLKKYTGLDITRKIRDLNEEELERVAQTIKRLEGWVPGKLTVVEAQKQIVDTLIQQNVR